MCRLVLLSIVVRYLVYLEAEKDYTKGTDAGGSWDDFR